MAAYANNNHKTKMPTGYQITDQKGLYFLTFVVVDWIDILSRKMYVDIILESLKYCRKNKGLKLWSYVIMTNHVHLIMSTEHGNLSDVIRDFKRFTATEIMKRIRENKRESRRKWMIRLFQMAATKHKRNIHYQFWRHDNHAVELVSRKFIMQKMAYIHNNPVAAGFVDHADHWMYSSQRNYSDLENLMDIDLIQL